METGVAFLVLGDLAAGLALVVMLVSGETTEHPEPLRTALGTVHGVLSLAGFSYAVLTIDGLSGDGVSSAWGAALGFADLFAVVLVAVVLALSFPEREPGESAWPLWRTTLTPLAYTLVWGAVGALTFHRGWTSFGEAASASLAFLGVHYTLLTAGVFVTLLVRPPSIAPAADMALGERLRSAPGVFFEVLLVALFVQGGYAIATHHEALFGHGSWGPVVAAALWVAGLVRSTHDTWRVFARA